jgi:purine-cytosine permease-like protein
MGFSLEKFFNDFANSSTSRIINNPVYTAVLIVVIVILIVYVMFRTEINEDEYSFWNLLIRTGVYLTIPLMGIMFVHYNNVKREFEKKYENKGYAEVVGAAIKNQPGEPRTTGHGETEINPNFTSEKKSDIFDTKPTLQTNLENVEIKVK